MSLPAESSPRSRTWPASLNATSVTTTALPSPSSGPTVTPHAVLVLIPFHMLQATSRQLSRRVRPDPGRVEVSEPQGYRAILHPARSGVGENAVSGELVHRRE